MLLQKKITQGKSTENDSRLGGGTKRFESVWIKETKEGKEAKRADTQKRLTKLILQVHSFIIS